jgi:hypothetical protein
MKRSQEMMSLVGWIFEEAGLAAESMALTSGGDRMVEDEDGDWRVGNNGGRYGRNEERRNGDFNKPTEQKTRRSRMLGEDDASSGEKTAPYHNHPCLNRAFRGINGEGSPLSDKPCDEHGLSINAAQRGSRQIGGLSDGLYGADAP